MRKITLLFAVLLSLVGVTQVKAATLTETFDEVTVTSRYLLSNGWIMVHNDGTYQGFGGSYDYQLKSGNYDGELGNSLFCKYSDVNEYVVIPTKLTGTFTYYAKRAESSDGTITFYEATEEGGVFTIGSQLATTSTSSAWGSQKSFSLGEGGKYVAFNLIKSRIDQISATIYEAPAGAALTVKDGATTISSPYAFDFGLAAVGTTKTFTLSNPGTAALEGLTVAETGDFGATLSATSIAAGGEATLTITMPATTSSSVITVSNTSGIADFVINASGTVGGYFAINTDGSSQSFGFVAQNAVAEKTFTITNSGNAAMDVTAVAPEGFNVKDGSVVIFSNNKNWSKVYLHAWNGEGNLTGDWPGMEMTTIIGTNAYGEDQYVIPVPAGATGIIFNNGSGTQTVNITDFASVRGYYVQDSQDGEGHYNAGTWGSAPAGKVVSVAASSTADFTVAMITTETGAKSGDVKLSFVAENATSFIIPVTGYVADDTKFFEDFSGNALPDGWKDNTGWTFSDGKAISGIDTQITLPALTVAEGEKMAISVNATGNYPELHYFTSTDGGSSWSAKSSNLASEVTTAAYSMVYIEGLAEGNYLLKLQGYHVQLDAVNGFTLNENAPVMEVTLGGSAIATGYADNFGTKVKAQPAAHTYTITNTGTGTLTGTITSSVPGHFTVSESSFSLTKDASLDFDLNLVFNATYEDKASVITIHPTNGGLGDVVINASATTKDPEIWEEDFESGIPATWINENSAWTTTRYSHEGQAGPGDEKTSALITPRLQATASQELQFDVIDAESETYFLKAEYSTNRTDWTTIENYTTEGTKNFVAPADGYYWLRFTGNYTYVDNFYGFKEAPLAHDANITASSIPTTGNQYVEYTATVTVQEKAGKAESGVVATLYVNGVPVDTDTQDLTANGSTVFTMSYTPNAATDGSVKAYVQVAYEDVELATDQIDLTIAAATVYDEDEAPTVTEGTIASLVLKYTAKNGWGTICVPFALSSDIMTSIFGEGWKAYEFKGFNEGALEFQNTTTFYAGYPYIVHVTTAAAHAEGVKLQNVNISRTTAQYDAYSGAYFRGTYAPIAAGGWTKNAETDVIYGVSGAGKIAPASGSATMKGFRAYFDLPQGTEARLAIYDDATGITTVLDAKELNNNGKVYNLNGQQVEKAKKGVFIVNGKKVVIK